MTPAASEPARSALQDDAERLAAGYGYNVDRLQFEYNRRSFGSYTTALDGSPDQRDRYFRALQVAVDHQTKTRKAELDLMLGAGAVP